MKKKENPYIECPVTETESFTIRLIETQDSDSLFQCYHDKIAVELMNDDNCDFGFFVATQEQMAETVGYWIDFYQKQYFIRFAVVDRKTGKAIGTIEGFGGETGVLRIDIESGYEKEACLTEILSFAKNNFYEYFGNEYLVTKAIPKAGERRKALVGQGWKFIDRFREYGDYYQTTTAKDHEGRFKHDHSNNG